MKNHDGLKKNIRDVEGFPTPGIMFKDITPLLEDADAFKEVVGAMVDSLQDQKIDKIVGVDARGFLLAAPVAYVLGVGIAIVRKKGKLPQEIIMREHDLEYGRAVMEIHTSAIRSGERIAVIDDVLATGGTAQAAVKLVEDLGGVVAGTGFLVELDFLGGRKILSGYPVHAVLHYEA